MHLCTFFHIFLYYEMYEGFLKYKRNWGTEVKCDTGVVLNNLCGHRDVAIYIIGKRRGKNYYVYSND